MSWTVLTGTKATAGSILNLTNITRVDPAFCVAQAESMIFTGFITNAGRASALRVRQMRKSASVSFAVGDSTEALPTRFLDPIAMRDNTNDAYIQPVPEEMLIGHRTYTDGVLDSRPPSYFAIFDEMIQLDCKAEEAISATLLYYEQPAPLSGSNTTNWLTDRYARLLLHAACAVAYDFDDDPQNYQRHMMVAMQALQAANAESDLSRRGSIYGNEVPL